MMTSQDSAMASAAKAKAVPKAVGGGYEAEKEKKLVFLWKVEAI